MSSNDYFRALEEASLKDANPVTPAASFVTKSAARKKAAAGASQKSWNGLPVKRPAVDSEEDAESQVSTSARYKVMTTVLDASDAYRVATEARRQTEKLAAELADANEKLQAQVMYLELENKKQAAIIANLRREVGARKEEVDILKAGSSIRI